jgi:hypothetical protein
MDPAEIMEALRESARTLRVRKRAGEPVDGTLAYCDRLLDLLNDAERVAV